MKTTEIKYTFDYQARNDSKFNYLLEVNDHWNQWYGIIGRFILHSLFSYFIAFAALTLYCDLFSSTAQPLDRDQIVDDLISNFSFFIFLPFFLYAGFRQYLQNKKIESLRLLAELQNYRENLLFNVDKFVTISAGRAFYTSLHPLKRHTLMNEVAITNDLLSALLQHYCNQNNLNSREDEVGMEDDVDMTESIEE